MKNILIPFLVLQFCVIGVAFGQEFQNLDFEYSQYKNLPVKWSVEGSGEKYIVDLDSANYTSGKKSLHASLLKAELYIYLILPADLIKGRKVEFEADIKTSCTDSLAARLLLFDPNQSPVLSNTILNNQKWNTIVHATSFPQEYSADRMLLGITAQGSGEVWIDNVKIKINGVNYGSGNSNFREPSAQEVISLNKASIPINIEENNLNEKDLLALKRLIGNAKIVGLGENSHGSSSIFKLKLRLVKCLVKNLGFTVFVLESPAVEADRINDYVLYGKGNREEVMKSLVYKPWQNEDIYNIIDWIKNYNETAQKKVEFRGMDMQDGTSALNYLIDYTNNFPQLSDQIKILKNLYSSTLIEKKNWKEVRQQSEKVDSLFTRVIENPSMKIKRYLTIFRQSLSFYTHQNQYYLRDQFMAENVDWLLKYGRPGEKIIISADNQHINKATGALGHYLSAKHGKEYVNIGVTYGSGTYSADGPQKVYEVHPPYVGTYEYFLAMGKYVNFILDLRNTKIDYLNKKMGFRVIGSRPQETSQFTDLDLKNLFDILLYLTKSNHSEQI